MNEEQLVQHALEFMGNKPAKLEAALYQFASIKEVDFPNPLDWLRRYFDSFDPNALAFHALGIAIRKWDRLEVETWIEGTDPFSKERRQLTYARLGLPSDMHSTVTKAIPIFEEADRPIVIADAHEEWYSSRALDNNFYWRAYSKYLHEVKGWNDDAIGKLDKSTDDIVRRMANPCGSKVYRGKGLVVGYVQSGKTANFSGVLAKAADAGYRLILVLAGTLDILRTQTQRRLDKELVGKELVKADYQHEEDWGEFLAHGGRPSELGAFDWERLTGPAEDYQELDHAIAALEFKPLIAGKPYNDPECLRRSPLRLIVIKKVPKVMDRLARDLEKIRERLAFVPTLIVDDESDQASINTIDPGKRNNQAQQGRTATNRMIVNLLTALPRAQYLGYTATPFANVFVDPNDAEDLFPKDFIISLPRPKGYMGVMDFYDFESEPQGFESNERAFVRSIKGDDCGGEVIDGVANPNHLQKAIDSFMLAGAIKLFREKVSNGKYKYKHHTMLVHHSVAKSDHQLLAQKVERTFDEAGYLGGEGGNRLRSLFQLDFLPVSQAKGTSLPFPDSFEILEPFIGECMARLMQQNKIVLIVNGDYKDDTPDFDKRGVWGILVGGTKLSRGYTVEGLTTTYFRRVSTTTDTLMQMGRWFGYRPGYSDLVRLFIGRDEPFGSKGKNRLDLYRAFEAICLDEEKFRQEIMKYQVEGITPRQVQPLVPSHLTTLRPTAKNKMFNAYITFKNYGGEWSESTLAPNDKECATVNESQAIQLLAASSMQEFMFSGKKKAKSGQLETCEVKALCGIADKESALRFLKTYVWQDRKPIIRHEIEFLSGSEGDPCIDDWLIMVPLITNGLGPWTRFEKEGGPTTIQIQKRSKVGMRFGAYTTSSHRAIAEYLSQTGDGFQPKIDIDSSLRSGRRGVMLLYPIMSDDDKYLSIGFALRFPVNAISRKILYAVHDKNRPDDVVVAIE